MANFAKTEFALEVKQKDGYSLREHLLNAWKISGEMPSELREAPPLPELSGYLWAYYIELHNRRANYGYGHVPLTHMEIEAWKRNTERKLDPWELKTIIGIDDVYMASLSRKKPEGS